MDKTIEERIKAIHPPKWGNGRVEIGVPDLILYKRYTPVQMFVITMGGIVLAEVIAMIVISYFNYLPYYQQVIMDATIMVTIIFPLIYFFSFEPLLKQMLEHNRTHRITRVRLRLMQYAASHSLDDLLQYILDEIETHSGSSIGFFHFLEADQKTLWLQAWSSHTLQDMCKAEGKGSHYNVDQAGVWVDCVKERKPVVHNDYATLAHRKGLPKGHAPIIRELSIPIMRADRSVAVLGQGNKPTPYSEEDVELVSVLADFAWDVVEAKRSELALRKSEEKFRTLVEWTNDWEKWVNPQGEIVYISPSCERITGYAAQEFIQNPELLKMIVHPDDQQAYIEHQDHVHDSSTGPMTIEYRILSRPGGQRWIEHMCRPLFGTDGEYLGRRISNRDVTERKQAEDEIREHNHREAVLANTIHTIQTDIARDLHDTLGQNIGFLRMNLEHACETHMRGETIPHIQMQSMIRAADESYELIRAMLTVLQPGDPAEPLNLFKRYAEQIAERSQFQINIENQGTQRELTSAQVRQLFYIFREALSNSEKYAHPSLVTVKFTWDENELLFEIVDNGRGFDPERVQTSGHYGLKFMRERAEILHGSFAVQSTLEAGTTITVRLPYEKVTHTNPE